MHIDTSYHLCYTILLLVETEEGYRMKAGFVARVRVNPKDCLSILDVVAAGGVNTEGMSFSAITSLAISSMLEAFRKQGTIPTNDGFDYQSRMARFIGGKSTYDKRVVTEALYVGAAKGLQLPIIERTGSTPPMFDGERVTGRYRDELWQEYNNLNETFTEHTPEQRARYKELDRVFST